MSADAKIWIEDGHSGWTGWRGIHDANETENCWKHTQGGSLSETVTAVEACAGKELRWEFRMYPSDKIGLVGYYS